ncbi:MAG: chemotaxis protein CheA [Desulfuromonadales bacterium]|nr:MAG: chemotaxis protein CheA [Desulfuromonadales bacterium]
MDMSQYRELFVAEAREHLDLMGGDILALEKEAGNAERIDSLFRNAHSIKGMAASMEYPEIAELAHRMEDLMDRVRKGRTPFDAETADLLLAGADLLGRMIDDVAAGGRVVHDAGELVPKLASCGIATGGGHSPSPGVMNQASPSPPDIGGAPAAVDTAFRDHREEQRTVRVRSDILDRLVNVTGELVTSKNRLAELGQDIESDLFRDAVGELAHLVRELRNDVMAVRMLPFSSICERLPRMVRDLARRSGKEVSLVIEGKEQELDRGILELLADPLVHILRNAVDHGIESPEERAAAGKAHEGRLFLSARREKDHLLVSVEDDGKGMDPRALVASAVAKGLISAGDGEGLSTQEAFMLTCLPGFSTAGAVTEVSGRGVGMDAVQSAVRQVGGAVVIGSEAGHGSRITLRLPLTVAIIHALLVACGSRILAVPVTSIQRTLELDRRHVRAEGRRRVCDLDGETVPLYSLGRMLGDSAARPASEALPVVTTDVRGRTVGLVVDRLLGQMELFTKPLGRPLGSVRGLAGGAILGDGRVVFILDLSMLLAPERRRQQGFIHHAGNGKGGIAA